MFFCKECRSLFNITKDIKNKQKGGEMTNNVANVFKKFSVGEKIIEKDLQKIKRDNLLNDDRYDNMNKKNQKKFETAIKLVDKKFFEKDNKIEQGTTLQTNAAYFICKFCDNSEEIIPGTLIYSKNYNISDPVETEDYSYAPYDQTLARTRNYICKNPSCQTHKNDSLKEAVLTKNINHQIVYVCCHCHKYWIG
uniref:TFIIS-type domain-containing protein n=1 Tax=viral metagenome TaxID=1070528 RepID=A0A6C0LUS1_9ZZZZ